MPVYLPERKHGGAARAHLPHQVRQEQGLEHTDHLRLENVIRQGIRDLPDKVVY